MPTTRRTKTFSGCWTCRSKHVKCDEQKPGCKRCQDSGLVCEGYEVRLSWTSNRDPDNFRPQKTLRRTPRRPKKSSSSRAATQNPVAGESTAPTREECREDNNGSPQVRPIDSPAISSPPVVEATTDKAAEIPLLNETASVELGSVDENDILIGNLIHQNATLDPGLIAALSSSFQALDQNLLATFLPEPLDPPGPWCISGCTEPHLDVGQEPDLHVQLPSATSRTHWSTDRRGGSAATSAEEVERSCFIDDSSINRTSINSNVSQPRTSHPGRTNASCEEASATPRTQEEQSIRLRHLDTLPELPLQRQLMQHWVVHMCDALIPIPSIQNPFRTIFTPVAWEGAQSQSGDSNGATALFHLICSASAFHLATVRGADAGRDSFRALALRHHNIGLGHLRQNMPSDDKRQCGALLASLIMCIINEAVAIPGAFWRVHLKGATAWVRRIRSDVWAQTRSTSVIYQMFVGLTILLQSQLLPTDRGALYHLSSDMPDLPGPYVLDGIFGISSRTLQHIFWINKTLMEEVNNNDQDLRDDVQSTPADWEAMDLELLLSVPSEPQSSDAPSTAYAIYHYEFFYYYAAITYFKRCLLKCPLEEIQWFVRSSLDHMETIFHHIKGPFAPLMWPIAVLSFEATEAESQKRILECLKRMTERSGLTVWTNFGVLLRRFWTTREQEGQSQLSWHDFLKDPATESIMLF